MTSSCYFAVTHCFLTILSELASFFLSIHFKTFLIKLTHFLPNIFILAIGVGLGYKQQILNLTVV